MNEGDFRIYEYQSGGLRKWPFNKAHKQPSLDHCTSYLDKFKKYKQTNRLKNYSAQVVIVEYSDLYLSRIVKIIEV